MVYSFATVAPEEDSAPLAGGLVSLLRGFVLAAISLSLVFVLSKPVLAQNAGGRVVGTVGAIVREPGSATQDWPASISTAARNHKSLRPSDNEK
jgi:hypothetical protein